MSKYTPGPWKVNEQGNVEQNNGGYHLLAIMSQASYMAKEREGNAQLISCAPEMLDALKQAIQEYEGFGEVGPFTMDQIKAIAAKAEGGNT